MKLIASIAAGAGIIVASFVCGQKYQAAKIEAANAKSKAQAEFLSRTHRQEVFLLESQLDKEVQIAKDKESKLIADIHSGKLRLRACAESRVPANNSAKSGTNVSSDDQSSRQAAESAVRVGAECDQLNVKFKALQDWAKSVMKQQEGSKEN